MKIKLTKGVTVGDKLVKEIELDFDKLKGKDLIAAEKEARAAGDQTPSIFISSYGHAVIAAKILNVPVDEILELPLNDFKRIIAPVGSFLLQ